MIALLYFSYYSKFDLRQAGFSAGKNLFSSGARVFYRFCFCEAMRLRVIRPVQLTLVMLNKLRCHAHFKFSANQIT